MDFVKGHKELYDSEHFKDKQGRSVSESISLTVASCLSRCAKTWFNLQRKLTQSKSGQALKEMTEHQTWIQENFGFLRSHIRCKGLVRLQVPGTRSQCFSPQHLQSFD